MDENKQQKKSVISNDQSKIEADIEEFTNKEGHERVIDLIVKKDDITWKTIILELVNSNLLYRHFFKSRGSKPGGQINAACS